VPFWVLSALLCPSWPFLRFFGLFWTILVVRALLRNFSILYITLVRGSQDGSLSQLDTLGYFGDLLGPCGPFWVLLVLSGMNSPFAKFQHFLRHIGRLGSGNHHSSLFDTHGPHWALSGLLGPFELYWALSSPSGMKSLFDKFQHLLQKLWSAGVRKSPFISVRHCWAPSGKIWLYWFHLCHFGHLWALFGHFLDPFGMTRPFEKFQHCIHSFGERGSGKRHSSLLDTLRYFWVLWALLGPFEVSTEGPKRAKKRPDEPKTV